MVDSDRLRQVIFNLVGNAAKFTSRGSVTVTAKCNEVTDDYADVQFIVSDTGIGIPQSRIDHLFEAFEQLDSSTTREFGGTGLGLTICKQIVDLMDGRIHVQSIEGLGSKFMIDVRLPFAKQTVDQDIHQIEVTEQRVATVGMSDPISKLLRDMFESYQVDAEFFNESDVIPDGKFDVVLLNSKGDSQAVSRFIAMQPSLSQSDAPILIPVVPADCVIKPEEWENLGVEKPIFKPFTQTRFLQPVYSSQERGELAKADTFQSSCGTQRTLRVMICEDNMVNQMFAKEICRKAGIEVVVCDNGKIAVDELALDSNFDAIFMDCHMPVMDGFEATRKIHELVEADIIAKIPVIALTANALADDRDKCLDVGMDDYLTKPFEIGDFLEKIHTNALLRTEVEPSQTCDTHCHESIFDIDKLESQFNDRQFALDIAEQFVETLPEFKADLEDCRDQNDAEKAFKLGHRLKGTAGTVQATRIKNSATELESAARNGQIEDLENQISKVLSELESFATVVKKEKASWAVKV
jgi:CheY-like chemotaxis protein/HPt (histidine-containing phosphotransfer) domain-containing protein